MEAVGAAASLVGIADFALTVGETIWKIRKLWVEVQEAPDTIKSLQREISMLEKVLPGVNPNSDAEHVASHCREALGDLQNLVKDLSSEIDSGKRRRRGLAKLKVLLKKGDVEKFQCSLDRALNSMQIALASFQATQASLQSTQLDMVCIQMVQLTTLVQQQAVAMDEMRMKALRDKQQAAEYLQKEGEDDMPNKARYSLRKRGRIPELPWVEPSSSGYAILRSSRSKTSSICKLL
ncbi:hypothetical protein M406DRAFT_325646 [Cryphonectria parasitica EP155]|uniref:Fungal N-terminal domain-containing protein n=1 Tax=Cryphonectria parasitica (strain ATCC 38755 / EP155) TaxID=660469 RepID=A0A9P4YCL5_CRYP1|nr:uncharacterized protein M406DRAFT_325646 [Cryphonectria parasitica EP155]KAF3770190.1 hypothetical protein M406DRAFT_325646 [Cryphonectria parasitica EP155]